MSPRLLSPEFPGVAGTQGPRCAPAWTITVAARNHLSFARVVPRLKTVIVILRAAQLGIEFRSQFTGEPIMPAHAIQRQFSLILLELKQVPVRFCRKMLLRPTSMRGIRPSSHYLMPSFRICRSFFWEEKIWDPPVKSQLCFLMAQPWLFPSPPAMMIFQVARPPHAPQLCCQGEKF